MEYSRRDDEKKTVVHDGQRKLLISEIEFLTKFGDSAENLVYVGASNARHLLIIHDMFPDLKMSLYDDQGNIPDVGHVYNRLFDDKDAMDWAKQKNVLFISDIRTVTKDDHPGDDVILDDMEKQRNWHRVINPKASSLKFRLPFNKEVTQYLSGDLYFPVWGPPTTTECRLFVSDNTLCDYDNNIHERRMAYFNKHTRVMQPSRLPGKISRRWEAKF
eukprot:Lithocolla_globosa_v1_NODE_5062_length_1311_cov_11.554140.p1 type:complete len:217 gc:universal NODE_5062_length_1311_cov_11.554140:631-1281(+)